MAEGKHPAASDHHQTIHWNEPARPDRTSEEHARATASSGNDLDSGIVFGRTVSTGRWSNKSRARSVERVSFRRRNSEDNEAGLRHPSDIRQKQTFRGAQLFFLAYQSIGVIYGDIGTSPLYVYSSVFSENPSREDLIGVLSIIIWSLLWMVTLKYVVIILHADNEGEGGTFSCYSLLSRFAHITNRDVREEPMIKMERYRTGDLNPANQRVRTIVERSKIFKGLLKVIGVYAVSMVMSDGVLTPAQSVLGAVQGLNVIVPNISNATVVGATCGILVLLFIIQPFGTTKIGVCFAPIVIIWLGLLAAFGIYNLAMYDAGVFKAFNPGEAFSYLIRHGQDGWRDLGGVLLAFTGVEALFADLGAFSMRAIQISWLCYCLPCLLLAYIGQAAYIAVNPAAYAYPVFNTAPPGCLVLSMVVAILAAIVASQAIITATFQLVSQIVKLSYFPTIRVIHTSKTYHNQLFVPLAAVLLCIGTVVVTAVFENTTSLGQAYGVCVMFVTFFDTQMVTLASILVWRFPPWLVVLPWLAFSAMDAAFLSSALTKVPNGAWFTLTLATVLALFFIEWRFGKEQQWKAEAKDRNPLTHYVKKDEHGALRLVAQPGQPGLGEAVSVTKGFGIFFDKGGEKAPLVFLQFLNKLISRPEVSVFFHLRALETPSIPEDERWIIQKIGSIPNCFRVVARCGYMDEIVSPNLASLIHHQIQQYLVHSQSYGRSSVVAIPDRITADVPRTTGVQLEHRGAGDEAEKKSMVSAGMTAEVTWVGDGSDSEDSTPTALATLQNAFDHRVLYIVGKEDMHIAPKTPIWRIVLLKIFFFLRENTRNKVSNLKIPADWLVEIGFVVDV